MARQGLPKKYAKMGFKKGWKAFKASKRTRKASRPKTKAVRRKRTTNRKVRRMTRRKSKIMWHGTDVALFNGFTQLSLGQNVFEFAKATVDGDGLFSYFRDPEGSIGQMGERAKDSETLKKAVTPVAVTMIIKKVNPLGARTLINRFLRPFRGAL